MSETGLIAFQLSEIAEAIDCIAIIVAFSILAFFAYKS